MPSLGQSLKREYGYNDSIKNNSHKMEKLIIQNYKMKDAKLINDNKYIASGIKKHILSFDKKLKAKIKNNI